MGRKKPVIWAGNGRGSRRFLVQKILNEGCHMKNKIKRGEYF